MFPRAGGQSGYAANAATSALDASGWLYGRNQANPLGRLCEQPADTRDPAGNGGLLTASRAYGVRPPLYGSTEMAKS